MYSPNRGHDVAIHPERQVSTEDRVKTRSLALPALAAAVHVSNNAAVAARARLAARAIRPFVHEDDPTD